MSYNRWQGDLEKLSNRDRLCFDIDEALAKKPHDFEGFLGFGDEVIFVEVRTMRIAPQITPSLTPMALKIVLAYAMQIGAIGI